MNKVFAATAAASMVFALAACGKSEAPAEQEAQAEETVAQAPAPGLYEVTLEDGSKAMNRINADGTYADIVDGKETGTGKWASKEGKMCFDGDAEGQEEACWSEGPVAEDGSWTATGPNGETATVRPVAEEAPAA